MAKTTKKNLLKEGDKCPECKKGKIALMSALVSTAEKDQEPYVSGKIEGNMETVELNDNIKVHIHACDNCGKIMSRWFDDNYD